MKVMVLIKATKNSEAGIMPSTELLEAMGVFNEQLVTAGVLVSGEGLHPSAKGKRVSITATAREVSDGPFSATSDLVAGFWIWNVKSMEDALTWAKRCPAPMPGEEAQLELRPLFELEDFGEDMSSDLRDKEAALRDRVERK